MLAHLRSAWAEVPDVSLASDPEEDLDADDLVLRIVWDVGEMARNVAAAGSTDSGLGWSRANLIADLESYRIAIEAPG
jgi:hypothetical protein